MVTLVGILDLARFQFAMTTIFHFFFVPMSIGLGVVVSIMETMYVIKKDEIYKKMAQFWGKIFLLSFAVGVVTGLIQEFQFGMNWSEYSRYVGDIFGSLLAIEALVAFFAESTFIGLWSFTWDRFKPSIHVLFIWITTIGSAISSLWILAANSFMQNPVGYAIDNHMGRAELKSFGALLSNRQLWVEFPHVVVGTLVTAGFLVAGMSAFKLLKLKKNDKEVLFFRKSINIALIVGLVGVVGALATGDKHAFELQSMQPMKYAAMEGVDKTITSSERKDKAQPWSLISVTNPDTHKVIARIEIPYVLSILGNHSLTGGNTTGTTELEKQLEKQYGKTHGDIKNYYVPENTLFYAFRVMAVGAGGLMMLGLVALWMNRRKTQLIHTQRWFLWILGIATFVPFIINTAGWLVTELGRYPWVVYGLMPISAAVSPNVSVLSLLISNIIYFLTFATLGGIMIWLSRRVLHAGPNAEETEELSPSDPYDNLAKGAEA
ncbi:MULTISPECIES: cytochrome ubiquinol oxidase subunit I [Leuconostoc]|uniref:Cytochrome bd-type quinol oxidase, subunit 1 n=2 Tax=Leuconostoc citreum TaxID=33964 RepID=B1MXQ2_LEUCK|nr:MULTISPECIES: cytochrome ubiquinol oxidase subunit I [Leuconostoc]ACA82304.1 Cytochrome bd-type quinol oxidase, subunit 1 [Leuconostoc citreum KM20]KAF0261623.1 cytochrome ubiquinol oxidase subunit I [Leuconostoc citreum]MBA5937310.1 cytochrome ubiquinol oxidase subunit I [Leuconostoc citreum]MBE4725934.1 cytochrome ubiquinol oxidase subunit I [Leuconostoc citreum]MBU7450566.1 cytochrome ubiquinol oxidase subunit I [Leuconostoc citreum]